MPKVTGLSGPCREVFNLQFRGAHAEILKRYSPFLNQFGTETGSFRSAPTEHWWDSYTGGHSCRVQALATRLARKLGLSKEQVQDVRLAAALHDIGKNLLDQEILHKPGGLTPEERAHVEQHAEFSETMLIDGAAGLSEEAAEKVRAVTAMARHHHSRWDGRENHYPRADKHTLRQGASVIAVADFFDALTSERPYREKKFSVEETLAKINEESGRHFDPAVVGAFNELVRKNPRGFRDLLDYIHNNSRCE